MTSNTNDVRASTGIAGLDAVLGGGLPRDRIYLLDGEPGTGKTTIALQFLLQGREAGERVLYVTLSETASELRATAESHGWTLDGLDVVELAAVHNEEAEEVYTLFHPADIELQQTVEGVLEEVERINPQRVVFDSLSEMRMLARDPLRFRRQILSLKHFFSGRACTALLLDDRTHPAGDLQLHSLAHGVIQLEHLAMEYGAERRRLQVTKLRGARFRGGYHDFRIRTGGVEVYPRILRRQPPVQMSTDVRPSGSAGLDMLLGGGIGVGTSVLLTGAAGAGKSVLAMQYACTSASRGEHARVYLFDERVKTALERADGLGIELKKAMAEGRLAVRQVEPTEMSPGEFAQEILDAVEKNDVKLVVLDSLNGYLQAMPAERLLLVQIHELLSYLSDRGVTIIMTLVQHGLFGGTDRTDVDVSYLADTVILLRYFEHGGAVRRAISVVKKRNGTHENVIREFRVEPGGVRVGEPLVNFRGVLTGVPQYTGAADPLFANGGGVTPGGVAQNIEWHGSGDRKTENPVSGD